MKLKQLKNSVEILDFDITVCTEHDIEQIRSVLHKDLVVIIRGQNTDPRFYFGLVHTIGDVANYNQMVWNVKGDLVDSSFTKEIPDFKNWIDPDTFPIQRVTGMVKGERRTGIFGTGILDWHCNLNGPDRADGVALQALEGTEGTMTSWLNTAIALEEMPKSLYNDLRNSHAEYEYAPDIWAKGLPENQLNMMMRNPIKYKMHLIQKNCAGVEGIYFYTNNRCNVVSENSCLQDDLADFLFDEKYMYHHEWHTGDIVISDQLLTLHKRQQNDPEILSKRVLNRITFKISNYDNFILNQNTGIGDHNES